jgi:Uma2 family endonuclease
MKSSTHKMTYEQYRLLPEDGKRYELIDGELLMTPSPSPRHQRVVKALAFQLSSFVESNGFGEVFFAPLDAVFDDENVLEPDILFNSRERAGIVGEHAVHGSPDLVVEVLSPSSFYHDLRRKLKIYSQFGVQEYWIADPEEQTLALYTRAGDHLELARQFSCHEIFESPLLPGFRLAVQSIF